MESNIKKTLDQWMKGVGPFSFHPLDMNRFYELVLECIKEDYVLTQEDIEDAMNEHRKLIETKVHEKSKEFEIRSGSIIGFVKYLKDQKGIDILSMI